MNREMSLARFLGTGSAQISVPIHLVTYELTEHHINKESMAPEEEKELRR